MDMCIYVEEKKKKDGEALNLELSIYHCLFLFSWVERKNH